jgi:hypothetical protein
MLLGFSDRDARDRVVAAARLRFRRVSVQFALSQVLVARRGDQPFVPAVWLSHGGLRFGQLAYAGEKPIHRPTSVGSRRCLIPFAASDDPAELLAGVWAPTKYSPLPHSFEIVRVDNEPIIIGPENWDNWLNPERDVRPMLRPTKKLVVPGQQPWQSA